MLQDELFEEKKRPFMRHFLADLDKRFPGVLRGELGAVRALSVLDDVLDLEDLLQDRRGEHLYSVSISLA